MFADRFEDASGLALIDITAHRLVAGQTIRLHNDYIGHAETHRLLVHLNRGWDAAKGGLLMLFGSHRPEDVRAAIIPRHGTAFAFAISPKSFHAVSTILSGDRFTLVYTFRKA
jgi:Rps23 Pro-64 3,4-dihydroxylase Tpa1-like proline 4-hydroxylase